MKKKMQVRQNSTHEKDTSQRTNLQENVDFNSVKFWEIISFNSFAFK